MRVSWGKKFRYSFESAGELQTWRAPTVSAVFAITYKQNPAQRPKSHTVLYFGHAENLSLEMPGVNQQIHELWNERCGNNDDLYVFLYPMPGSTRAQRASVQWQLVSEYSPAGNY